MDATDLWHSNMHLTTSLMEDVYKIEARLEADPEEMSVGATGIDWNKTKAHICDAARALERANAEIWEGIKDDTP